MYRYIVILLVGFWTASPAFASTWADGLFETLSRDFGSVPRGPVISHPFRIVNNTGKTVRITNVRVSCGCVTASVMQPTLAPGQETAVMAKMDTRRFSNSRTVTIYVTFDQPTYAEVRLWVRANSREDVGVYPDTLAFGNVKRGEDASRKTTISLMGSSDYRITGISCESNYVQPVAKMVRRDGYEVSYELTAGLRKDTPPGRWYTDIWVTTNNPAMPKVRIPLTVEVQSALSVSPNVVLFGNVKSGSEQVRKIIVRGVQPFRIVGVRGTDKQVRVMSSTQDKKSVHVLTIRLRPAESGTIDRTIHLETDLGEDSQIDFTTRAYAEE